MKLFKTILLIMVLFAASLEKVCGRRIKHAMEAEVCHLKCADQFNCACEEEDWRSVEPECIPFPWLCDAQQDCSNTADEIECICPPYLQQCSVYQGGAAKTFRDIYNCMDPHTGHQEGAIGCWNRVSSTLECYDSLARCDGFIHCSNAVDEMFCTQCPSNLPRRCNCNKLYNLTCEEGYACYDHARTCDGRRDCTDGTDEEGCTSCRDDMFTCDCYKTDPKSCSGDGCTSISQHCDGQSDCSDGSDEETCTSCRDGFFTCDCYKTDPKSCSGRRCVWEDNQCDGRNHCSDGSDEEGCACREYQFTCDCYKSNPKSCTGNGCILTIFLCDGEPDCSDGSDEEGCSICRNDLFTCECYKTDPKSCSGSGCISQLRHCDQIQDCSDGSDEVDCTCNDDQFTCDCFETTPQSCSGRGCIGLSERCDGYSDCSDGSDEEGCSRCREDLFTCDCYKTDPKSCVYGCVPINEHCDGYLNCIDGSDESGCTCSESQFTCDCYKTDPSSCSGNGCISMREHCDGHSDCSDGSDEEGCTTCTDHFFTCECFKTNPQSCSEGGCISMYGQCDGFPGCSDGSDEIGCTCDDDDFTCDCYKTDPQSCSSSGCIPLTWRCDGDQDCDDGSDEEGCTSCRNALFTCNCYTTYPKSCSGNGCISMNERCNGYASCSDGSDENGCTCQNDQFTCDCYKDNPQTCSGEGCVLLKNQCDGYTDCADGSDEESCTSCRDGLFTCDCYKTDRKLCSGNGCISMSKHCDAKVDCHDGSDEDGCTCEDDQFTCSCYNSDPKSCSFNGCISISKHCNGDLDCEDGSDEEDCTSCRDGLFTCDCYKINLQSCFGIGCVSMSQHCDGDFDCSDGSDEEGCTSRDDLFFCGCYRNNTQSCFGRRWIKIHRFLDGVEDCEDGSDEPKGYYATAKCADFDVIVRRFDLVEQCNVYVDCDNSTCFNVPALNCTGITTCNTSQVICTSHSNTTNQLQSCNLVFQCENEELEIANNFCDGKNDCTDRSDEIANQPGFKCSTSFGRCVLPQRNLYDSVAQCNDSSDLCLEIPCFECLDRRLNISTTQLCDGIIDCFDLSDECLCEVHLRTPICEERFILNDASQLICGNVNTNCQTTSSLIKIAKCQSQLSSNQPRVTTDSVSLPSIIRCQNRLGEIRAVTCDGRPECRDFSDECSCENPPSYCNDGCHGFYPLGDRYCDGIIDEAWKFINDSSCPEGFDEASCPQRFKCKAENLVSIDLVQVCDGTVDCDDESDEVNCPTNEREAIFSSKTEMIENEVLRIVFWFIALIVIIGNSVVIMLTTRLLIQEKMSEPQKFNHILLVNLSISDFFMGIYLLIISVKSVQFSGTYGDVDYKWRTSLECSITGSIAVISSETSCFIMTILTSFRLYNILNPFASRSASTTKWKLGIVLAWSVSLLLALIPVFQVTSDYFIHEIWFSNQFTSSEGWNKTDVMTFACRLASLSNHSIENNGNTWQSTKKYLSSNFPNYSPRGEAGYYSETSICMPRIYTTRGEHAWLYSLVIVTFNFVSFLFVAVSYALIYNKASNRPIKTSTSDEQTTQMQRRIARLIATDFACWIPICIMVYLKVGGLEISNIVYLYTAGLLLPINSALNPLLYSPIIEKYFQKLYCSKQRNSPQTTEMRTFN